MKADAAQKALVGFVVALIAVLLVAMGFLARAVTEPQAATVAQAPAAASATAPVSATTPPGSVDGRTLDEIIGILKTDFVDPTRVNSEYLYDAAINGMFQALGDPHSTYLDPQTYTVSKSDFSGTFQGIGATVAQQGSYVVIVRPLPGTPAAQAGLKAGDVVLSVDGADAQGWTVEQAVIKIRGPRGTAVALKVRHVDGSEQTLSIVRDEIQVDSVTTDPPTGPLATADGTPITDLGYVRIRQITQSTPQEVQAAIQQATKAGDKGLLIDLRGNPGGLLNETVQLADMFLDKGTILSQQDRDGNEQSASATPGTLTDVPVVILQDEFSASGAEVFAAALQENGRATVVGTKSFGKGTVNHLRELSNGGAVYVSIGRWLTPLHNQIEGHGITPDVPVTLTTSDIESGRDVTLFRAIDVLREEIATGKQRIIAPVTPTPVTTGTATATAAATP